MPFEPKYIEHGDQQDGSGVDGPRRVTEQSADRTRAVDLIPVQRRGNENRRTRIETPNDTDRNCDITAAVTFGDHQFDADGLTGFDMFAEPFLSVVVVGGLDA